MAITIHETPLPNPHSSTLDVHYRLYLGSRDATPTVICVQDFDYYDYKAENFLDEVAHESETEAYAALNLLTRNLRNVPDLSRRISEAKGFIEAGLDLTREQALYAFLGTLEPVSGSLLAQIQEIRSLLKGELAETEFFSTHNEAFSELDQRLANLERSL